jgi:superfamily II DNA or RNA helicase
MVDLRKERIQIEAVDCWTKNNKVGTVEVATGHGKTFIAFRCILTMPKRSNVLFLAETQVREKTIKEDVTQYKKFYGKDPFKDYNVKFGLYQSAHKYKLEDWFPNDNPIIVVMDRHLSI